MSKYANFNPPQFYLTPPFFAGFLAVFVSPETRRMRLHAAVTASIYFCVLTCYQTVTADGRTDISTTAKGPFIATQLNSTRRRVELSLVELCRYKRALRLRRVMRRAVDHR